MKRKNKYQDDEKVILIQTGEEVTIKNFSYVANMNRFSYTLKEYPATFYFEEEIQKITHP